MKRLDLRFAPLIALLVLLLSGCTALTPATSGLGEDNFVNAHAIIIVRHGDIDSAQKAALGNRVPLLASGEARARELAAVLRDAGINRVVTSSALRTQQTAAPMLQFLKAENIDISPEEASGHGSEKPAAVSTRPAATSAPSGNALAGPSAEAAEVVAYLAHTAKPTDIILVVHHHSVIPSLVERFSHSPEPAIDDATEYDRCYIILPDASTHTYRVLRLRYGGKIAPGAGGK